jgi:hypothetical protein
MRVLVKPAGAGQQTRVRLVLIRRLSLVPLLELMQAAAAAVLAHLFRRLLHPQGFL